MPPGQWLRAARHAKLGLVVAIMFCREFLLGATDQPRTYLDCKIRDNRYKYVVEARNVEFLMVNICSRHWEVSVENIELHR